MNKERASEITFAITELIQALSVGADETVAAAQNELTDLLTDEPVSDAVPASTDDPA